MPYIISWGCRPAKSVSRILLLPVTQDRNGALLQNIDLQPWKRTNAKPPLLKEQALVAVVMRQLDLKSSFLVSEV